MADPIGAESWERYQKLVLGKLEDLEQGLERQRRDNREELKELSEKIETTNYEVGQLKVRSSIWGGLAGVVSGAVAGFVAVMKK